MRPAKAFYPAHDLLLSSGPRYMQQQTAKMILIPAQKPFFVVFATDFSEKRPEFLAKTFFFGLRHQFAQKRPKFLAKTFFFIGLRHRFAQIKA